MKKAKFKVGQVVCINTEWYDNNRPGQKYQKITRLWPWPSKKYPYGYNLANGDKVNEIWLKALTKKEAGQ